MNRRTQTALAAAIAAALTLGLGACGSKDKSDSGSGDTAAASSTKGPGADTGTAVGGTPVKGGTLTVLTNQDFAHLDPARNWTLPQMDFGTRLIYRTLVTFKAEPGDARQPDRPRPGHRHRPTVRRRQDLVLHPARRAEVRGRFADQVLRHQVQRRALVLPGPHRWPRLRGPVPGRMARTTRAR